MERYKIKLRNAGYRLVYEVRDREVLVLVVAVGKRERNEVYKAAARRGGRRAQLLHTGFAGPDHPMLLQLAESAYLKALFFRLDG